MANSAPPSITNTATVSGGLDGDPSNNDASDTVTVSPAADLGLLKTMTPMQPIAGGPVSFTITATNHGPSDATNAVVTDPVPAQITGVTATTTQGTCTVTTTVTCALGTVPMGGTVTITVQATVAAGTSGQPLSNTAQITADQVDPNLTDNLANVTAEIMATTLKATKTVASPTVEAGATVSYRLAITVTGPAAATNVTACDTPPPNTDLRRYRRRHALRRPGLLALRVDRRRRHRGAHRGAAGRPRRSPGRDPKPDDRERP